MWIPSNVEASLATFESKSRIQRVRGIKCLKTEPDLDRYREILRSARPDVVVETGTRFGGSALWFEDQHVDVITVDVDTVSCRYARPLWQRTVQIVGDAGDPRTVDAVRRRIALRAYERVMVVLDDLHTYEHVKREIPLWADLVSAGQYLVIEDGIFDFATPEQLKALALGDLAGPGGPLRAIVETMPHDSRFVRDDVIETQFGDVTHHPAGWWWHRG